MCAKCGQQKFYDTKETAMKIAIDNGSLLGMRFIGMGAETEFSPKTDLDGNVKTDDDGRPVYSVRALSALRIDKGTPVGAEQNVSLAVVNPPKDGIAFGKVYEPSGKTTVVHYVNGANRIGVSITTEDLVPYSRQKSGE